MAPLPTVTLTRGPRTPGPNLTHGLPLREHTRLGTVRVAWDLLMTASWLMPLPMRTLCLDAPTMAKHPVPPRAYRLWTHGQDATLCRRGYTELPCVGRSLLP